MQTLALPFPSEWLIDELPSLYREQPTLLDSVLHNLWANRDVRWSLVVRAYRQRRINLGKAAELLGMHELELRERFVELGIPLRVGAADLAEARAEVEAVRAWYGEKQQP
jgi:predicted HTH domain antitoxin